MRVFVIDTSVRTRIEWDASKEVFAEHPEQPFTFIAETEEEHLDILELIKKYTTISEPPIDEMDAESVEYQRMRHKEVFGE
jgi:hypothetical protein